jgi:hypothetical protein
MTIFPLQWNSRTGFCSRCHRWLGEKKNTLNQTLTADDLEWQTFVVQQIGEILAAAPTLESLPKRENLQDGIVLCINSTTNGNTRAFTDLMYLGSTVRAEWRNGHHIPQLEKLLRICYRLSIPLLNFLTGKVTIHQPLILNPLPICQQFKQTHRPFDPNKMQQFLQESLKSEPPQSVYQLAAVIQYDPGDLYKCFPDLCQRISARYKSYKKSVRRSPA